MEPPRAIGRMSATAIGWAIGAGLACGPVLLLTAGPWWRDRLPSPEFDTVDVMYRDVADRVARGQVPYRDFLFEYPIGSLPQVLLPRLAGGGVSAYRAAYVAGMLLANAMLVLAVAREVECREGRSAVPGRLGWFLLGFVFLGRLMVSRLDVVPALLGFLAAAEWSGGRPIRGGVLAAVGGLVKLFPAMVVLPAGWREMSRGSGARPTGLLAFAAVFAAGLLGWAILGGLGMLDAILFHAERGLEIESVGAGLLMLAGRTAGMPMTLETGHGAIEVDSPWSPAIVGASRYVQAAALAITMLAFARSGRRPVLRCTGALLLASMATAPVLSPQFLIWILPFVLVVGGPTGRRARPLFVAASALTFLIYPVLFFDALLPMRMPAILLLNVRNAMVIALWAMLTFGIDDDRDRIALELDDRPRGA